MDALSLPRESRNDAARIQYIKNTRMKIGGYAQASRKAGGVVDITTNSMAADQLAETEKFLSWLETSVDMNPDLRKNSNLQAILETIYAKPDIHFPQEVRVKAQGLIQKWEQENWGAPAKPEPQPGGGIDVEDGNENGSEEDAAGPTGPTSNRKTSSSKTANTKIHYPPSGHPIWGQQGIFHGLAKKENMETHFLSTVFNDRYFSSKRDPKVYGHNGLAVGTWFPSQLSALFYGAVGSSQGGISGHTANGAYSVVVSNAYEDLDTDNGEVLYYSGSGSHENTDPQSPRQSTTGTKCLKASYHTGNPVRVMRTASRNAYSPAVGLRYDGLYKVVSMKTPKNSNGGLYEQFRLVRLDEPKWKNGDLEGCRTRPTVQEQQAYAKREVKYW